MAKATAVRNIRDDHQKAFLKIFNSLCGRFNRWQVWQDFVMVTAIEISNATDKQNAPERTKTYQTIISKYSDAEQNKFAELLAEVIMGMEQNPDQDFLGELYMLCELGNDASGQFFTPYDVCRCMVEISGGSDPAAENAGFFSVSDPACGAGALLIAFANLWWAAPGGAAKQDLVHTVLFYGHLVSAPPVGADRTSDEACLPPDRASRAGTQKG